jgi:hypothetical protein
MFFETTLPAPTKEFSPIITPQIITEFAPIEHPSLNIVFLNRYGFFQSPFTFGYKSFVVTVFGPKKTLLPISTPS